MNYSAEISYQDIYRSIGGIDYSCAEGKEQLISTVNDIIQQCDESRIYCADCGLSAIAEALDSVIEICEIKRAQLEEF